jgi:hypothetical protein
MYAKPVALAAALSMLVVAPGPAPAQQAPPLPMTVEIERDPIDDSVRAFAIARTRDARLSVGCNPRRYRGVRVMLAGAAWLTPGFVSNRRSIRYRFDDAPARRARWQTRRGFAYLRSARHVLSFMQWIAASNRLAVRTRDVEGREIDLIFALEGGRAAIDRMLTACGDEALRQSVLGRI